MTGDIRQIDLAEFEEVLLRAAIETARLTRQLVMQEALPEIAVKADGSLLVDDEDVEKKAKRLLAELGVPVYGEELGLQEGANTRYLVVVDPIDGTRRRANRHFGGHSYISYVYDTETGKIILTITACPGTGEFWIADITGRSEKFYYDFSANRFIGWVKTHVWQFDPDVSRPSVYVDNPNPFPRRGVDMLGDANLTHLQASIRRAGFTGFFEGSNGLNHALVASGGAVVGCVTTSIGGIQDLGGIRLVLAAGGVVKAYRLSDDRELISVDAEADLLVDGGYDFLICAIDDHHLGLLQNMLEDCLLAA